MDMASKLDDVETKKIPVEVEDYLGLDLAKAGTLASDLMGHVDDEAKRAIEEHKVALADIVGPHPAHLTQKMLLWYQSSIESRRKSALDAVIQLFKDRSDTDKGVGFILEARLSTLREQYLRAKLKIFQEHRERNHTRSQEIADLSSKVREEEHRYRYRKQELGGRDAVVLNRTLYIVLLVIVLFGPEALLNLESFAALPWASPFIAWGATILIGVGIGFAAHFHGTLLKQWAHYFDKSQDDSRRGPAWRMFVSGSVLLSVSLSFVYYARFAYFQSYVASVSGFGQTADANAGLMWVVGGSLLGNFIVYLVGCLIAYIMHDSDPDYSDNKSQLDKNSKKLAALKQAMEADWQREIEQLNAQHKRKTEEARRSHRAVMEQSSLAWPQEVFTKIKSQDSRVVAALLAYRHALLSQLGAHAKNLVFVERSETPHLEVIELTLAEYEGTQIELKYLEGG
jgi:hypothetical protein